MSDGARKGAQGSSRLFFCFHVGPRSSRRIVSRTSQLATNSSSGRVWGARSPRTHRLFFLPRRSFSSVLSPSFAQVSCARQPPRARARIGAAHHHLTRVLKSSDRARETPPGPTPRRPRVAKIRVNRAQPRTASPASPPPRSRSPPSSPSSSSSASQTRTTRHGDPC